MTRGGRFMSAAAMVLSGGAILLSVVLYVQVQADREAAIRLNCETTNEHHDAVFKAFDREIARLPPGPRRQRALAGRAGSGRIINALAPKRDCGKVVRQQLHR